MDPGKAKMMSSDVTGIIDIPYRKKEETVKEPLPVRSPDSPRDNLLQLQTRRQNVCDVNVKCEGNHLIPIHFQPILSNWLVWNKQGSPPAAKRIEPIDLHIWPVTVIAPIIFALYKGELIQALDLTQKQALHSILEHFKRWQFDTSKLEAFLEQDPCPVPFCKDQKYRDGWKLRVLEKSEAAADGTHKPYIYHFHLNNEVFKDTLDTFNTDQVGEIGETDTAEIREILCQPLDTVTPKAAARTIPMLELIISSKGKTPTPIPKF